MKINGMELGVQVSSYTDGNLFVGLYEVESGDDYADVTINIPGYEKENPYDAFLSGDLRKCTIELLEKEGLCTDTGKTVTSGMGQYKLYHFSPGRLNELDTEGYHDFEERRIFA